jgi:hypothetical protein
MSLPMTKEARKEERYVKEYGEEQFFKDLEAYEKIIGKTWDEIVADEQPCCLIAVHKKALKVIEPFRLPTADITKEEAQLLDSTNDDFYRNGKTDIKCPRCGDSIILIELGSAYAIGCRRGCVNIGYRGI